MKKYYCIYVYLFFSSFFVHATHNHLLEDADIIEYAQSNPAFDSVCGLEVKLCPFIVLTYRINIASCVHIGEGVFLTDAHCLWPFCQDGDALEYEMSVSANDMSFPIEHISIHPEYMEASVPTRHNDIALFYAPKAGGIPYSSPLYADPKDLIRTVSENVGVKNTILSIVGYGVSGGAQSFFSKADGVKRAVRAQLEILSSKNGDEHLPLLASSHHREFKEGSYSFVEREPLDYEAGPRPGMSGGAVFNENNEFIALHSGQAYALGSSNREKLYGRLKNISKYLAFIIPSPFIIPLKGELGLYMPLSYHRDFIEGQKV